MSKQHKQPTDFFESDTFLTFESQPSHFGWVVEPQLVDDSHLQGPGCWLHQDPLQGPNAQSVSGHATRRGKVRQGNGKKWQLRNLAEFLLFKL